MKRFINKIWALLLEGVPNRKPIPKLLPPVPRKTGYLIFESYDRADLIKQINEAFEKGFICQGEICITSENDNYSPKFYQAMIKDEN